MFEFQKKGRLSWKHVSANFAVYQSELLLQEKQIGHLLQLLNSARSLLGNFNFEEDYFLERIFMYLDLNCFGNPLRTEYAPFFNRFLPLPTSPEKKKKRPLSVQSLYVLKRLQLMRHIFLFNKGWSKTTTTSWQEPEALVW